jgi:hypothetical protein
MAEPKVIAPFKLYMTQSDSDYHVLDDGNPNRTNITQEETEDFTIAIALEKAIHGKGKNLNSFLGFRINLRGANDKRQFKSVTITIRVEDEKNPGDDDDDPDVVKIWPDRDYFWQGMTVTVKDTKSLEGQLQGGASGAGLSLGGKWSTESTSERSTPASIYGDIQNTKKRARGSHRNAMVIRMIENRLE